ncbi:MFS transporter [Nocardioides panzhihuensis]|uniref:MFS family permease n=1 Tax=Nocardioides panzhihuensis TaxID=860243 RepID=A0A7Z0DL67_9ACTN|nr:MFS family permease [Nocardioides panzhihuensis]
MNPHGPEPSTRAWVVWGIALAVYGLAVFHRSSLAVAGLVATERFGISASQLATFVMLQLLVYAAMQVPVGLLVDRFGSRTILTAGVLILAVAQAGFAFADSYPLALLARTFVGMGDAMTFICVLRLVPSWFPLRRVPLVSQLTGTVGQLGAIAAAVPMTWALGQLGWTWAYLTAALIGPVLLVLLLVFVHDGPGDRHRRGTSLTPRELVRSLRASWYQPGTRLGFWIHFSTPFSSHLMGLLWGFPFLVASEGLSDTLAGSLLSVAVVAALAAGPVIGLLAGRHPWHRSTVALTMIAAMASVWALVLAWPGEAPLPVLLLLMCVVGAGGPASMIGFDVGRTSNPPSRMASASGIINQGGFVAALLAIVLVGWILDWRTPEASTTYTPEAFRWAMSVQYLFWGLGVVQIWRHRRDVRRRTTREQVASGSSMVAD